MAEVHTQVYLVEEEPAVPSCGSCRRRLLAGAGRKSSCRCIVAIVSIALITAIALAVALCLLLGSPGDDVYSGDGLMIMDHGRKRNYYISTASPATKAQSRHGGQTLRLHGPCETCRAYLMSKPDIMHSSADKRDFKMLRMKDASISLTLNLNGASCGTLVALYLVKMPTPWCPGSAGDFYCDANAAGGCACPEMDLFEANMAALVTSAHDCQPDWEREHCDGNGHAFNIFGKGQRDYGWSQDRFDVFSALPFEVTVSFAHGQQITTLSQNDTRIMKNSTHNMSQTLSTDMALVFSYWAPNDHSWFDSPPCGDASPYPGWVEFSNISISHGSALAI